MFWSFIVVLALGRNVPQVLQGALVAAGLVITLTWVAMPFLVKIAHPWLHPQKLSGCKMRIAMRLAAIGGPFQPACLRQAARMFFACAISYGIAILIGFEEAYWAPISAVYVARNRSSKPLSPLPGIGWLQR